MSDLSNIELNKVRGFPIFENLDLNIVKQTLTDSKLRQLKHREYLYRAGEQASSFCLVVEGAIKLLRHSPRGEDIIMHFALEGDLVGALMMNQQKSTQFPISAKSMGASRVLYIPKQTYSLFWKGNAEIQTRINSILYSRMSNIQDDKVMSTSPLRVRMANLLLRHLDMDSKVESQSLSIALTRQEIADTLGVAVESVIRVMRDWQLCGVISKAADRGPEFINIKKLISEIDG
jgi:CRP-like cAMP-binding protein